MKFLISLIGFYFNKLCDFSFINNMREIYKNHNLNSSRFLFLQIILFLIKKIIREIYRALL